MSVVTKLINFIKENKIVLTASNFTTTLNRILHQKDFQEIENSLVSDTKLFTGFNYHFLDLNNKDKLRFSSFVFLYFMHKSSGKNFNTELLDEYIIIYDFIKIDETLQHIENMEIQSNVIHDIENIIKANAMIFENQQNLYTRLSERDRSIAVYKFKKAFLNLEIPNILKSDILILKFLKYLKLISEEEIEQIKETCKFLEYKKYNKKYFEGKIINEKKFFTETIKPIYSLDEYADMIMNTKEYLDEEKNKQKAEMENVRSIKMENYLITKKDSEIEEKQKDMKLENIKTFNINELSSLKEGDEDISDEEERILNERKEYYSNGNTHNKG